ncbi:LysR family transcriptional regulator [Catenuloplanes indicus]|uniref:DNA-binding transcriptional LysR family regulator n=1 Tax=Catenuloplanes indicus TaxID=137267 RepID=A0AAE3W625_9ACTN|nr:LysR family transcriptional regulator [Catenuloplanes indicus]MDQ0369950.1 DNA-binding transcriptional LysR family regulator [Catenuloplanes indicus]
MHGTRLERVDLNLLPALSALLDERQISRAAERAGLSQSAMSRAFHRLRRTLGDDLLIREGVGYRLTPRAERIHAQLAALLPVLGDIFDGQAFDPGAVSQTIHLAGTDYAADLLGTALSRRLLAASPRSTVRFHPAGRDTFDLLVRGDLDLALFGAEPPAPLRSAALFEERFVCVVADTHPLARARTVELADYLSYRHLVIDIAEGRQPAVDRVLETRGTPRDAGSVTPFHAVAPRMLSGTSLVLTFPARMVATFAGLPGLCTVPAPPEIDTMTYRMAWHPRLDHDPAHRWLRDTVLAAAGELDGDGAADAQPSTSASVRSVA